jgi:hypothetical protein
MIKTSDRARRAIFVHGFAKSEQDNIERDELVALKKLAVELSAYDEKTNRVFSKRTALLSSGCTGGLTPLVGASC